MCFILIAVRCANGAVLVLSNQYMICIIVSNQHVVDTKHRLCINRFRTHHHPILERTSVSVAIKVIARTCSTCVEIWRHVIASIGIQAQIVVYSVAVKFTAQLYATQR